MNFGKKLLIISITGLIALIIGYFIGHAVEMSKSVDFDSLVDKTFHSSNKDYQLKIISDSEIRYFNKEDYFSVRSFDYSDNFLLPMIMKIIPFMLSILIVYSFKIKIFIQIVINQIVLKIIGPKIITFTDWHQWFTWMFFHSGTSNGNMTF